MAKAVLESAKVWGWERGERDPISLICRGFVMTKALLIWKGWGLERDAVGLIWCGFVMTKALLDLQGLGFRT